jgi:hypothetical protein
MTGPTIYVRDPALNRIGQLDDFARLHVDPKFNDVGSWELELDRRVPLAAELARPGYGLQVIYNGNTLTSGPTVARRLERQNGTSKLAIRGVDDNVWLARRFAHMQPASLAPPYSTNEHDVRTGRCSTVLRQYADVNAGPGAIVPRRVPGLVIGTDPLVGTNPVTGRARLQVLIEFMRELAAGGGGLGFRVVQVGLTLEFQVYLPVDRSQSVKFSEALQNIGDYTFESSAPEANWIICAGGGEGTARTFVEGGDGLSQADWGRIELMRDRRDTTVTAEMQQTITEELAEKAAPVSLTISPFDTTQQRYGEHYGLGDRVTVIVEGEPIVESIRQVSLTYDASGPLNMRSTVGTPGRGDIFRVFKALRDLRYRVTDIERR